LESIPKQLAIVRANQYAVDHGNVLIAYVWHTASNARNLLEYAEKKAEHSGLQIIRICYDLPQKIHSRNSKSNAYQAKEIMPLFNMAVPTSIRAQLVRISTPLAACHEQTLCLLKTAL